jgi:hypothetical protein
MQACRCALNAIVIFATIMVTVLGLAAQKRVSGDWNLSQFNFIGRPDLKTVTRTILNQRTGGLFEATTRYNAQELRIDLNKFSVQTCSNVLNRSQQFSFNLMLDRGEITKAQFDFYSWMAAQSLPDQISFSELTVWLPIHEVEKQLGRTPNQYEIELSEVDQNGMIWVNLRRASLGMTSAQVIYHEDKISAKSKVKRVKMPWQNEAPYNTEPLLNHPELQLEKDFFAWEWKNAGSLEPKIIDTLIRTQSLEAYQQLRYLGGNLNKALIFVHSITEVTTNLYERVYKFKRLAVDSSKSKNCILVAPLSQFINAEKYKPELLLEKVSRLIKITDGKLTGDQALDFLDEVRRTMRADLTYTLNTKSHAHGPIVIFDRSVGFSARTSSALRKLGILDKLDQISSYLNSTMIAEKEDDEAYAAVAPPPEHFTKNFSDKSYRREDLQISGLSIDEAIANPDYVKLILLGSYHYYLKELEHKTAIKPLHIILGTDFYVNEMMKYGIIIDLTDFRPLPTTYFSVITDEPKISQMLADLGAIVTKVEINNGFKLNLKRMASQGMGASEKKIVFENSFTGEQIYKLAKANSALSQSAQNALVSGYWQRKRFLQRTLAP